MKFFTESYPCAPALKNLYLKTIWKLGGGRRRCTLAGRPAANARKSFDISRLCFRKKRKPILQIQNLTVNSFRKPVELREAVKTFAGGPALSMNTGNTHKWFFPATGFTHSAENKFSAGPSKPVKIVNVFAISWLPLKKFTAHLPLPTNLAMDSLPEIIL